MCGRFGVGERYVRSRSGMGGAAGGLLLGGWGVGIGGRGAAFALCRGGGVLRESVLVM
jgi:hypothetical protein